MAQRSAAAEQGGGGRHSGENQRECEKHCSEEEWAILETLGSLVKNNDQAWPQG